MALLYQYKNEYSDSYITGASQALVQLPHGAVVGAPADLLNFRSHRLGSQYGVGRECLQSWWEMLEGVVLEVGPEPAKVRIRWWKRVVRRKKIGSRYHRGHNDSSDSEDDEDDWEATRPEVRIPSEPSCTQTPFDKGGLEIVVNLTPVGRPVSMRDYADGTPVCRYGVLLSPAEHNEETLSWFPGVAAARVALDGAQPAGMEVVLSSWEAAEDRLTVWASTFTGRNALQLSPGALAWEARRRFCQACNVNQAAIFVKLRTPQGRVLRASEPLLQALLSEEEAAPVPQPPASATPKASSAGVSSTPLSAKAMSSPAAAGLMGQALLASAWSAASLSSMDGDARSAAASPSPTAAWSARGPAQVVQVQRGGFIAAACTAECHQASGACALTAGGREGLPAAEPEGSLAGGGWHAAGSQALRPSGRPAWRCWQPYSAWPASAAGSVAILRELPIGGVPRAADRAHG
eukprot:TRINITY_DN37855_c0_g1_i2.p1 TRINITY_DN37855_c0_g1~~TRINITY_DN37855_c0_g1_i2.p1  ORF type:complete len:485 (+),score=95.13 TRINITY_DN37855_c0_g1_i2:69-1457(+)